MDSQNKRTLNVVTAVITIVVAIAGFVLIGLLSVLNGSGVSTTFGEQLNAFIQTLQNMASFDPNNSVQFVKTALIIALFGITYVIGLVLIIMSIINVIRINKEGGDKRVVVSSLRLSYVLLIFFGFLVYVSYYREAVDSFVVPDIGAYIGLGLGALGVCLSTFNYLMASEKPMLNKILRVCLMMVSFVASIFVLMPTIVVEGLTTTPIILFFMLMNSAMSGGTVSTTTMIAVAMMLVLFIVAAGLVNGVGICAMDERVKKDANKEMKSKNILMVVLAAVAAILTAAALFVAPMLAPAQMITLPIFAYIAIAAMGLALVLAIVVIVLAKNEKVAENAQEVNQNSEVTVEPEPVQEPAQEEQVEEEAKAEDNNNAQVAETVVVADAVMEEAEKEEAPVEKPVQEEPVQEEVTEAPAEEEKAEEAPVEEAVKEKKAPAKKATPKAEEKKEPAKKAPSKKAAPKAEEKEEGASKKNTASYHLSKRASDNKWQVFRAGSNKVIKLFDTKVEAEEYTKRMAENQGVSYLSHASKGKNKGRIQKK